MFKVFLSELKSQIKLVAKCERGLAFIELALSIPLLFILLFCTIEVSRLLMILQKLEKTTSAVADVVAQANPLVPAQQLTVTEINNLFSAAEIMMSPYGFNANQGGGQQAGAGNIIMSDVTYALQPPNYKTYGLTLNWQCTSNSVAGAQPSKLFPQAGKIPGTITLPQVQSALPGFTPGPNPEEMLITESYYEYSPITTLGILKKNTYYRAAVFTPRYGSAC